MMGIITVDNVRPAIESAPDPRLEPCQQCRANGWVPIIIPDLPAPLEDFTYLPLLRNMCNACHGEGWVLK